MILATSYSPQLASHHCCQPGEQAGPGVGTRLAAPGHMAEALLAASEAGQPPSECHLSLAVHPPRKVHTAGTRKVIKGSGEYRAEVRTSCTFGLGNFRWPQIFTSWVTGIINNFVLGDGMREDLIFGMFCATILCSSNLVTFCVHVCLCACVYGILFICFHFGVPPKQKAEIVLFDGLGQRR